MIARAWWVIIAFFAMLAAAPCLAQEAPSPSPPPAPPAPAIKSLVGRGGVGGLIGGSYFYTAEDYSYGAQFRFDFSGQFRYGISSKLRFQMGPGFTWSAYSKEVPPPFSDPKFPADSTKESYLTQIVPISAQIQLVWGKSPWLYHVGVGPGLYRTWVENHRKILTDPVTLRLHRGVYWGTTAELGVEHFLKALPNTTIEVNLAHHYVFTTRGDQFPTGWNSSLGVLALRVGTNYYFDLNRPKKTPDLPGIK